jgi:hypothetical protein
MAPLLASQEVLEFDILAIQEPFHSTTELGTYCPRSCEFYPIYKDKASRVCLLINKRINTDSWHFTFHNRDYVSLVLQTQQGPITVHNCYSQPPGSFQAENLSSPIYRLAPLLLANTEHLLLGDFNVHHPWWCSPRNPATHLLASSLVELVSQANLDLLTPNGLPTFDGRGVSTIDLAFASSSLANRLVSCDIDDKLCHNSDHKPIAISFEDPTPSYITPTRLRQWKKLDKELIARLALDLPQPLRLQNAQELDDYIDQLNTSIQSIVEHTVP